MSVDLVGVYPSGAIRLGQDIACDGFFRDCSARVQTHLHLDHMHDFETSKGHQNIYLTEPTLQLLVAEFDADLPVRQNIITLSLGSATEVGTSILSVLPTDHMLGSVQVAVQLKDGTRVGYSGDFQWPVDRVIEVEVLVVDSTYGAPQSVRRYSQAEAEERLLEIVQTRLRHGPVYIKAHRGTLQRGLQVLSEVKGAVLVGTPRLCSQVQVYLEFGYPIAKVIINDAEEGLQAIKSGRYIRLFGTGDHFPVEMKDATTVTLSAFMTDTENPVLEYSERSICVALSDHADFNGTIEYVRSVGARRVITDNTRGGHAVELARELSRLLGIEATPSLLEGSHEWGM